MTARDELDPGRMPTHIACVMDGNGRWAEERGLKRTQGHLAGEEAMFETVTTASDLGVGWLTLYAFSTENWKRPISEVRFLMKLNETILLRRLDELQDRNIRMRYVGRGDRRVPRRLAKQMEQAEAATAGNTGLTLTVAFNYGGRAELIDAMRRLLDDGVAPEAIDEDTLRGYLYAPDMPDPDLVVRTSGEYRLSNFLLWELAYSELVFTDRLWPDFGAEALADAIGEFQGRQRRFGAVRPLADRLVSSAPGGA